AESRHRDVEQDQVGRAGVGRGKPLLAVGRLRRLVALGAQPRPDDVAAGLAVVDDEDACWDIHGFAIHPEAWNAPVLSRDVVPGGSSLKRCLGSADAILRCPGTALRRTPLKPARAAWSAASCWPELL